MDCVRTALASSRDFTLSSVFEPWDGLCCSSRDEFISRFSSAFAARLAQKKKEVDKQMYLANSESRQSSAAASPYSESGSTVSVLSAPGRVRVSSSHGTGPSRFATSGRGKETVSSSLRSLLCQRKTVKDTEESSGKNLKKSVNETEKGDSRASRRGGGSSSKSRAFSSKN